MNRSLARWSTSRPWPLVVALVVLGWILLVTVLITVDPSGSAGG